MLWWVLPSVYPNVYYTQMVWNCRSIIQMRHDAGTRSRTCVCRYYLKMIYVNCTASTLTYSDWYSSGTPVNDEHASLQITIIARINNTWKILRANIKPNVSSIYWGRRKSCYWGFRLVATTFTPMSVVLIASLDTGNLASFFYIRGGCRIYECNSMETVWYLEIPRPFT